MQPDPAALHALADRVEAGETGQEIDAHVWAAVVAPVVEKQFMRRTLYVYRGAADDVWLDVPPLTTSLDAIQSLRERVLPGWSVSSASCRAGCSAWYYRHGRNPHRFRSDAPTEIAARLAALLRALEAKARAGETG